MRFMIAFLALLAMPMLAAAEEPTVAPPKEEKAAKPKKPRKVCRLDANSASRIPSRICKLQEEWDQGGDVDGNVRGNRAN